MGYRPMNTRGLWTAPGRCLETLRPIEVSYKRTVASGGMFNGRFTVFSFLGWILFGLVVGVIAKLIMPGRDPGGFIVTILLGIAGAVIGGWMGRAMGLYGPGEAAGFFMALLGAIILLALYRVFARRRTTVV